MKKTPAIEKLRVALLNGQIVSRKQITSKFGLNNPTAAVSYLRKTGYNVVSETFKGVTKYSLAI